MSPRAKVASGTDDPGRFIEDFCDHMLAKEPGTRQAPRHQDQPYCNTEGRQNVRFWIPVDPVSRASTLEKV